jgi:hypothetical protein
MLLTSPSQVIRCLITYVDWWQPSTASTLHIAAVRHRRDYANGMRPDGFRPGLLETLDERTELCRRIQFLSERDRQLLFLWYVVQFPVEGIAEALGISRRHCFRRRAAAISQLVEPAEPEPGGTYEPPPGGPASG